METHHGITPCFPHAHHFLPKAPWLSGCTLMAVRGGTYFTTQAPPAVSPGIWVTSTRHHQPPWPHHICFRYNTQIYTSDLTSDIPWETLTFFCNTTMKSLNRSLDNLAYEHCKGKQEECKNNHKEIQIAHFPNKKQYFRLATSGQHDE